ncbi:RNA 2',3'-cyclic phosphodiesterase [Streptomyces sp. NPDC057638]|uniref:RNA 2',3'-cyclic phosphodiesterase n=1 Tax=Streptomyces sp. NPDC057638 TaxID=3346190 RepID=UPI0036A4E6CA
MRIFAAVLPPEDARAELSRALDRARALPGADGLRWTGRANWHFTLAFMGETDAALLPDLQERLGRAARRGEPFRLRLRGGGQFGGRALWVGAAGGISQLRLLAERSEAAARRAGVPMGEHRRYTAHLTVARNRADTPLRPFVEELHTFEGGSWEVTELCLVRSNLPTDGVPGARPRYELVSRWPLGPS